MKYIFPAMFYLLLRTVFCADVAPLDDDKGISEAELSVNEATPSEAEERQLQRTSSSHCIVRRRIMGETLVKLDVKKQDHCHDLCSARLDCRGWSCSNRVAPAQYHAANWLALYHPSLNLQCSLMENGERHIVGSLHDSAFISCTGRAFKCMQKDITYWSPSQSIDYVSSLEDCYTKCMQRTGCKFWSVEKIDPHKRVKCVQAPFVLYQKPGNGWISGSMDCNRNPLGYAPYVNFYLAFINLSSTICEENIGQPGTIFKVFFVEKVEYCQDFCAIALNCKLWFVAQLQRPRQHEFRCSLVANKVFDEAKIATLKHVESRKACTDRSELTCLEKDIQYWSPDLKKVHATTAEMCYSRCRGLQRCKYFSSKASECWLFMSVLYKTTAVGWTSGTMEINCVRPTFTLGRYQAMLRRRDIICEADGRLTRPGTEIALLTVKEVNHCQELCSVSNCKVWIITKTFPNRSGYECSLRISEINDDLIRSLRQYPRESPCTPRKFSCIDNVRYIINSPQIHATARTIHDCYNACRTNPGGCKVFVFQESLSKCSTSTTQEVRTVSVLGFVSGSLDCGASSSTAWKTKSDGIRIPSWTS